MPAWRSGDTDRLLFRYCMPGESSLQHHLKKTTALRATYPGITVTNYYIQESWRDFAIFQAAKQAFIQPVHHWFPSSNLNRFCSVSLRPCKGENPLILYASFSLHFLSHHIRAVQVSLSYFFHIFLRFFISPYNIIKTYYINVYKNISIKDCREEFGEEFYTSPFLKH